MRKQLKCADFQGVRKEMGTLLVFHKTGWTSKSTLPPELLKQHCTSPSKHPKFIAEAQVSMQHMPIWSSFPITLNKKYK